MERFRWKTVVAVMGSTLHTCTYSVVCIVAGFSLHDCHLSLLCSCICARTCSQHISGSMLCFGPHCSGLRVVVCRCLHMRCVESGSARRLFSWHCFWFPSYACLYNLQSACSAVVISSCHSATARDRGLACAFLGVAYWAAACTRVLPLLMVIFLVQARFE